LAAIFDPVFTASYPNTHLVEPISLFGAILGAFKEPMQTPPANANLVDLPTLVASYPHQAIVVFPECTTTNGRGILKFSPSLLSASTKTKIFPISLRYTAADITTPVPRTYTTFLWNLLSKPTHCIRVRIAESVHNSKLTAGEAIPIRDYTTNSVDTLLDDITSGSDTLDGSEEGEPLTAGEKRFLDKVGEALARLGRVKRVGLGVKEKAEFVKAWTRQRR
jgi:hypothetical protein